MRNCIVCGSNQKKEYFNSSVAVPSPYPLTNQQKIVKCKNCDFIFSDSNNTLKNYQEYYLSFNKHKKRAADAEVLDKNYYKKIYNFINSPDKNIRILDFGSGDLLLKKILTEKGYKNVFTFDVDSTVDYKKEFDLIITTHTFEHILNGDLIFKELVGYLKDDGRLLIATPDVEGYLNCYCGPYNWFDLEHINHFSSISLTKFVENNDLSIIKCIRDKREVRPNLFYPEIIIYCSKNKSGKRSILLNNRSDTAIKSLEDYLERSKNDFNKALNTFKKNSDQKLILWGLGISMRRLIYNLGSLDGFDLKIVDSDPKLWNRFIAKKKILSPKDITNIDLAKESFVVFAVNFNDIIKSIKNQFGEKAKIIKL